MVEKFDFDPKAEILACIRVMGEEGATATGLAGATGISYRHTSRMCERLMAECLIQRKAVQPDRKGALLGYRYYAC